MQREIARLCFERAMTVNELASLIPELNRSTLQSIANGRWRSVALSTGRIIAKSLRLKLELSESEKENEYFVRFVKDDKTQDAYGVSYPDNELKAELEGLLRFADRESLIAIRDILLAAQGMRNAQDRRNLDTVDK